MILVDTDHLTVLSDAAHTQHGGLLARIQASVDPNLATPVVSIEEQLRGWLALIHRLRDIHRQMPVYERLIAFLDFTRQWEIIPLDERRSRI